MATCRDNADNLENDRTRPPNDVHSVDTRKTMCLLKCVLHSVYHRLRVLPGRNTKPDERASVTVTNLESNDETKLVQTTGWERGALVMWTAAECLSTHFVDLQA